MSMGGARLMTSGSADSDKAVIRMSLMKVDEYCEAEEYEAAMKVLAGVLEASPENAEAWQKTGMVAGCMGDLSGAKACMERSLKLDADNSDYMNNLGFVYQNMDMGREAVGQYVRAIQQDEDNVDALRNLIGILDTQRDMDTIRSCLSRLAELDPEDSEIRALCGEIFENEKECRSAGKRLQTRLKKLVQNTGN